MPTPSQRVAIVDHDQDHRTSLLALMARQSGVDVVGHAADGFDMVWLAVTEKPDVVICDLALPGLDALAARPMLRSISPATRMLVVTDEQGREAEMVAAGVDAWVDRSAPAETLVDAVLDLRDRTIDLTA